MRIVSTSKGFALIFSNMQDLNTAIEHLSGLKKFKENKKPNYLYWPAKYVVFDSPITKEEAEEFIDIGVF